VRLEERREVKEKKWRRPRLWSVVSTENPVQFICNYISVVIFVEGHCHENSLGELGLVIRRCIVDR
jgi:hypothetical protein